MQKQLLFLPFLSLLSAGIAAILAKVFTDKPFIGYIGWALAATLLVLWVVLDFASFKKLFRRKGAKYGASSGVTVLIALAVIVVLANLTSRPRFNKSFDVTKSSTNTLSDQSKTVIKNLNDQNVKVQIVGFFQDENSKKEFKDLIQLYEMQGAQFDKEFIDPQTNPTKAMAEKITSGNTVIFRTENRDSRITTFNEEKVTNALVNVFKKHSKKIYFTKGHGEGELNSQEGTGFELVVQELKNNKYEVESLSLLEQAKVPEDADLVVIAGAQFDFKQEEARLLDDFLKQSGALLVMVEALTPTTTLNGMLEKYGIKFNSDILIMRPDDPRVLLYGQTNAIVSKFDDMNLITKDFAKQSEVAFLMPKSRSIETISENTNKMKVDGIAKTSESIIKVNNVASESDLRNITKNRLETGDFNVIAVAQGKPSAPNLADNSQNTDKDEKKDVTSQTNENKKNQDVRIVAIGSSAFATNEGANRSENLNLFMNINNFLLQDESFISIRPKDNESGSIRLTGADSQLLLFFLVYIYPLVFLGWNTFYWFKRRNA